jgi:predicted aspartyl protease
MQLSGGSAMIPFSVINPANGLSISGTARIDTGADITVIDPRIASAVKAVSTGSVTIIGVTGEQTSEASYTLDINFGIAGYMSNINLITDSNLSNSIGVDMLIGVDVLQHGIFYYDGQTKTFDLYVGLPQAPISEVPAWLALAGLGLAAVGIVGVAVFATWETKQVETAFSKGFITGEGARWL